MKIFKSKSKTMPKDIKIVSDEDIINNYFNHSADIFCIRKIEKSKLNKKILVTIYDYVDCHNLLIDLFKTDIENITIVTVGEYVNKITNDLLKNKFEIIYSDYDRRIELLYKETLNTKTVAEKRNGVCNAAPEYSYKNNFYKTVIDECGVESFHKTEDRKLLDCLSDFTCSYEFRREGNKSVLCSFAAGTPVIVDDDFLYCIPKIFTTEENFSVVGKYDIQGIKAASNKFSTSRNELIKKEFIKTCEKSRREFIENIKKLDFSEYYSKDELKGLIKNE